MSKKEMINDLIQNTELSFEEIVVKSESKASYVKSCFTKLDLNWEDRDDPAVELKTEIVEVEEGTEILEVSDEDIPEDAETLDHGVEIVEIPKEDNKEEAREALSEKLEAEMLEDMKFRRQLQYQVKKALVTGIKSGAMSNGLASAKRISKRMFPKPSPVSNNNKIYHLMEEFKSLI